jgi:hypothetical protein
MGYIRHHAMIITDCDLERIKDIHRFAELCNLNPTPIMESPVNGYDTFFIPPDGSKEGWEPSNEGDEERKRFKQFIRKRHPYCDWTEISYGGDDGHSQVEDDCTKKDLAE